MKRVADDDFDRWWNTNGPWVEEPNVRRKGMSGVQKVTHNGATVYVKRQTGHTFRSLRYPLGRPTVMREGAALSRLDQLGVLAPKPLFFGARKVNGTWQGLLVTHELAEYHDLDTWYDDRAQANLSENDHLLILENLAGLLSKMHRARQQHGCMRSKHIFINAKDSGQGAEYSLALLDLEKSRARTTASRAARHDIAQLRRHSRWSDAHWDFFVERYENKLGHRVVS